MKTTKIFTFNKLSKLYTIMKRLLLMMIVLTAPIVMMAQDDDLYFTPSKKASKTTTSSTDIEVYNTNARNEDEYNRRGITNGYAGSYSSDDYQTGGGYDAQAETEVVPVDTIDVDDDESYYRYSRRLLRFHTPRIYALSSPYYWDLVYGYGIYDYLYDPFYDPFFYDPYFYSWGYGWGWSPWNAWYGPFWGWHGYYGWS
jgi:hypothetical protein